MFELKQVVPWGRSFDEYVRMFSLRETELRSVILGVADGPASFNAELTQRGGHIISVDPIFQFTAKQIRLRISETMEEIIRQTKSNLHFFNWSEIGSVDQLVSIRIAAMERFLQDYEDGRLEGRYLCGTLPILPFPKDSFQIALCSHFLFLYSKHLEARFHCESLREMARVAREVRVFPILDLTGAKSPHLEEVLEFISKEGLRYEVQQVNYEFQIGGNEMLRIWRDSTELSS